jgi:hypothetical protein
MFTPFQRWSLALPIKAWNLPGLLTGAGEDELEKRAIEVSFDLCPQTDRAMAQLMIEIGQLSYMEESYEQHNKY